MYDARMKEVRDIATGARLCAPRITIKFVFDLCAGNVYYKVYRKQSFFFGLLHHWVYMEYIKAEAEAEFMAKIQMALGPVDVMPGIQVE